MEATTFNRYRLNAPVVFWWALPDGRMESGQGVTREISGSGVHVISSVCPPCGARVQLAITLTPAAQDRRGAVQLCGEGMVTRAENDVDGEHGFAATVHFQLESNDEWVDDEQPVVRHRDWLV